MDGAPDGRRRYGLPPPHHQCGDPQPDPHGQEAHPGEQRQAEAHGHRALLVLLDPGHGRHRQRALVVLGVEAGVRGVAAVITQDEDPALRHRDVEGHPTVPGGVVHVRLVERLPVEGQGLVPHRVGDTVAPHRHHASEERALQLPLAGVVGHHVAAPDLGRILAQHDEVPADERGEHVVTGLMRRGEPAQHERDRSAHQSDAQHQQDNRPDAPSAPRPVFHESVTPPSSANGQKTTVWPKPHGGRVLAPGATGSRSVRPGSPARPEPFPLLASRFHVVVCPMGDHKREELVPAPAVGVAEQPIRTALGVGPQPVAHVHRQHEPPVGRLGLGQCGQRPPQKSGIDPPMVEGAAQRAVPAPIWIGNQKQRRNRLGGPTPRPRLLQRVREGLAKRASRSTRSSRIPSPMASMNSS